MVDSLGSIRERYAKHMDLEDLQGIPPHGLENLFATPGPVEVPRGVYRGVHLAWIPQAEPRPKLRALLTVGFELSPFCIDFDQERWWFGSPKLPRIGRFRAIAGRSRWRVTEVVSLHYEESRLPGFIKNGLYDEVKPLGPNLCLGIGGVNEPHGRGEQFWFALARLPPGS